MPYDEFVSWKSYYLVEPWGWHDREYRTSAMLAQTWNVHVHKRHHAKSFADYIRDMPKLIFDASSEVEAQQNMRHTLLEADIEERRRMIAQAFGGIAKNVKIKEA